MYVILLVKQNNEKRQYKEVECYVVITDLVIPIYCVPKQRGGLVTGSVGTSTFEMTRPMITT